MKLFEHKSETQTANTRLLEANLISESAKIAKELESRKKVISDKIRVLLRPNVVMDDVETFVQEVQKLEPKIDKVFSEFTKSPNFEKITEDDGFYLWKLTQSSSSNGANRRISGKLVSKLDIPAEAKKFNDAVSKLSTNKLLVTGSYNETDKEAILRVQVQRQNPESFYKDLLDEKMKSIESFL